MEVKGVQPGDLVSDGGVLQSSEGRIPLEVMKGGADRGRPPATDNVCARRQTCDRCTVWVALAVTTSSRSGSK